ncbi:MAG TPA: hypothetical protein HA258_03470 [Thermoplasmata archaeon]|nr:hypothetical protein [Thermoplasmata archaeon]
MQYGRNSLIFKRTNSRNVPLLVLFIIFSLLVPCFVPLTTSQATPQQTSLPSSSIDGQILFAPMDGGTTYLITPSGAVNHTWSSSYLPGEAVRWLGDGTILRSIKTVGAGYGGGSGGGVQKVRWDGTIEWDFRYNTDGLLTHHDILPMADGNVLLIAWETKTRQEAIDAGRNPNYVSSTGFMPDHIIEVKPTGPTSGDIVWEWHVWDHLIQDFDQTKENYAVVADHPELIDINYADDMMTLKDWLHTNSVDYNEQFDQILLSVHNFNEIWVIDHSTTTEEATGHTGGTSGKGGDLLYRWGNPDAYRAGDSTDQKFYGQHDATWIRPGCPGEGNILVFNNGAGRPGGWYSSVDEISPPVDEAGNYYLESGMAYGPEQQTWLYTADPPQSFIAGIVSGAERLTSGNTLICDGVAGRFFEVTSTGSTVWEYTNPYPSPALNNVFKIVYVPPEAPPGPDIPNLDCTGSLAWNDVKPGSTVIGTFQVKNIGDADSLLTWSINTSLLTWGTWSFNPAAGTGLTPEDSPIDVVVTVIAPDEADSDFEGYIRVENQQDPTDFNVIPVSLATPTQKSSAQWIPFQGLLPLLRYHPVLYQICFLLKILQDQHLSLE